MYRPDCDDRGPTALTSRNPCGFIYSPPPTPPRRASLMEKAWMLVAVELLGCAGIAAVVCAVVIPAVHEAEKQQPQRTSASVSQHRATAAAYTK